MTTYEQGAERLRLMNQAFDVWFALAYSTPEPGREVKHAAAFKSQSRRCSELALG